MYREELGVHKKLLHMKQKGLQKKSIPSKIVSQLKIEEIALRRKVKTM